MLAPSLLPQLEDDRCLRWSARADKEILISQAVTIAMRCGRTVWLVNNLARLLSAVYRMTLCDTACSSISTTSVPLA
jgi:hypothetical protein